MQVEEQTPSEVLVNGKPVHYAAKSLLPAHMQDPMRRYIENRIPPGSFLIAILENNLMAAAGQADDINRNRLFEYAKWLYNYAPPACYGSPEKVRAWLMGEGEKMNIHVEDY